ncbi:MAG: tripartite tricarboxylate transporter substrate binding protein [Betaproteobacteria bacterium]|nr:tripartite tricarboxylate transporter substrate binding protein [Betaproteobacteria bacterium]
MDTRPAWLHVALWILLVDPVMLCAGPVSAQNYPGKPIRIVTTGAGGGSDFMARLVAQGMSEALGQPVIIENRSSGVIPGEIVSRAQPDGYTLLATGSTLWIGPLLEKTHYDAMKNFSPISLTTSSPHILVVPPSLTAKSVSELIDLAKSRPGNLNYASNASGSSAHLAGELFKSMARVNIVRVPYKGGAPAINDLLGGQVQMMFAPIIPVVPHVKTGKLRALAVTSALPSALAPGLPTVAASGLPGYESGTTLAMLAPAGTPLTIIDRLNLEMVRALNKVDVREKFLNSGVEVVGSSPQQLAESMKAEIARLGRVIRDAAIHAD